MKTVAAVTIGHYRSPGHVGAVRFGLQDERIGTAAVFVLPNPSGRNASVSYAEMLAAFRALRRLVRSVERRTGD